MGRPREQYRLKEFREAREALDSYYSSLEVLAREVKRHAFQSEIDGARLIMSGKREHLRKAIEGLGFTCEEVGNDGQHDRASKAGSTSQPG